MTDSSVTAASDRLVWTKSVAAVDNQTTRTATDIGWLQNNVTRINIMGNLESKQKQDVYSFKTLDDGAVSMKVQGDKGLRVKIQDQSGRVIADSKPGMGVASTNWDGLAKGTFKMSKGKYFATVTRDGSVPDSNKLSYVFQAKMGNSFTNDYITSEQPTKKATTNPQLVASPVGGIMISSLAGGASKLVTQTNPFATIVSGYDAANALNAKV